MSLQALGGDTVVNTTTAEIQNDPVVATLADGGYVVAWRDQNPASDGSSYAVMAQRYDAAGAKVGSEFRVNTTAANIQWNPAVAGLADGGFVIAWDDSSATGGDTSGTTIRAQRYDSAGATVGSELLVNEFTTDHQNQPSVAGLADSRFVVSWTDFAGSGGDGSFAVKARVFDGATGLSEIRLNETIAGSQHSPQVAAIDGGFVSIWTDNGAVKGRLFTAASGLNASPAAGEFTVSSTGATPAVSVLSDGNIAVTWMRVDTSAINPTWSIYAQILDSAGIPIGGEIAVGTTTTATQYRPKAASLPDGTFMIVWEDEAGQAGDSSATGITAQVFNADGTRVGTPVLINAVTTGSQGQPDLAALSDAVVVVWGDGSQPSGSGSLTDIKARQFLVPLVRTGASGDDSLAGGRGNDTLMGGIGHDTLQGGAGIDSMVGGAGDDAYYVDDAADVVTEAASEGTDTVHASVSHTLRSDVEALILTGSAAAGTGNALGNTLTGNGLNNVLDGGAGADTMAGGAGHDIYVIDEAGDSVMEAAGEGSDTVWATIDYTLGADVENLALNGGATVGTGNAAANALSANFALSSQLFGLDGADTLLGHAGNDLLDGGEGNNLLYGGAGNDLVQSGAGNDWLDAGDGNDLLLGGAGHDVLIGATGADWLDAGSGNNQVYGGDGNDVLMAGAGNDWLDAGAGADQLYGGAGHDNLQGLDDNDWLDGGEDNDQLHGGDGADVLLAGAGDDWLDGGADADQLYGGAGHDVLNGAAGADWLDAGLGNNQVYGGAGNDVMQAGSGDDWLDGGDGDDQLYGFDGANVLIGGAGGDWMVGGSGYDQLYGGSQGDTIQGGGGGDWIVGGAGGDLIFGQSGADTFIVTIGELGGDYFADFESGVDVLSLQGFGAGAYLVNNGGGAYTLVSAHGIEQFILSAANPLRAGQDYFMV